MTDQKKTGLALLREPFPENQISQLPKPTKSQTEALKVKPDGYKKGIRCQVCGGWHHPDVIHLDYVGHAALTDRLLDVDPDWHWEPLAVTDVGLPAFDSIGGLWIYLHVLGKKKIGYGNADGKTGGNAIKEVIGDAMRNAAMRYGAALDLWHKGDLHDDSGEEEKIEPKKTKVTAKKPWLGPLDQKTLRDKIQDFNTDLKDVQDTGSYEKLRVDAQGLMDQAEHDWVAGFDRTKENIETTIARIKEIEGGEDVRNPFQ